jgi:hypothetical protein
VFEGEKARHLRTLVMFNKFLVLGKHPLLTDPQAITLDSCRFRPLNSHVTVVAGMTEQRGFPGHVANVDPHHGSAAR